MNMGTYQLSVTCPVLLGCYHSKVKVSNIGNGNNDDTPPLQPPMSVPANTSSNSTTRRHSSPVLAVKRTNFGLEVVIKSDANDRNEENEGGLDQSKTNQSNDNNLVVEEEIVSCRAASQTTTQPPTNFFINARSERSLSDSGGGRVTVTAVVPELNKKRQDVLALLSPSLNRDWLDFPFITDRKTLTYLSKGKTKIMFIMRGLSGSGKSSIVETLKAVYPDASVCSADQYFITEDGEYNFDQSKLGSAHGYSQNKAKTACQNNVPVIIVDNTNVKKWEMKFYCDTAKMFGYITVLVEPKTDWKFNPEELFRKNKHGVPLDILRKKVQTFDHIVPLYYGWFVSHEKSDCLYTLADSIFSQCLDHFTEFKDTLLAKLGMKSYQVDPDVAKEIVLDYYSRNGKTSPLLHCTAKFCGCGKAPGGKQFHSRLDVQASCGKVFNLTLTGLVMSRRTMGLRVTLDSDGLCVTERPYELEWDTGGASLPLTGSGNFNGNGSGRSNGCEINEKLQKKKSNHANSDSKKNNQKRSSNSSSSCSSSSNSKEDKMLNDLDDYDTACLSLAATKKMTKKQKRQIRKEKANKRLDDNNDDDNDDSYLGVDDNDNDLLSVVNSAGIKDESNLTGRKNNDSSSSSSSSLKLKDDNNDNVDDDNESIRNFNHPATPIPSSIDLNSPAPTLTLSDLMNLKIADKKDQELSNGSRNNNVNNDETKCITVSVISEDIKNNIPFSQTTTTTTTTTSSKTNTSTINPGDLNTLFPELSNTGFGRSAHLTMKTAKGVEAKETNFDILSACDVESSRKCVGYDESEFVSVTKGRAIYYQEEELCCVYFDKPIKIKSIFSGYY